MIVVNIRASQFEKRCFNQFLMIVHFIFQFPILANLIHAEMEELADLKEEKISLAIVRYLSLDQLVARVRNITIPTNLLFLDRLTLGVAEGNC